MSEVHRYQVVTMLSAAGATIGYDPHGPDVVMAADYDRVAAERDALLRREVLAKEQIDEHLSVVRDQRTKIDALQALLTAADERVNSEVTLRRSHAARIHELNDTNKDLQGRADVLGQALKFYADRDHYSIDDGLNWDSCSGEPANILWHEDQPWFIEDGSIARAALKPAEGVGDE
ncbi:hypothetical protein [Pseudomonas carnis]|uniref:hypothetical protein n=1 Tax=Pseudomonas carnis TaxID=2487355 RepID=UPI0018E78F23|nr:hypothetical protein [Pseudomonas carnis]